MTGRQVALSRLARVNHRFDRCRRCRAAKNPLRHILGGGRAVRPRFLFLFINPTHQNISSRRDYPGERRYPFIGVRYFYRLLAQAGFMDRDIVDEIYARGWRTDDERRIERSLVRHGVYVTNLVKCTQPHPENPSSAIIREDLPLLHEEIDAVRPAFIVTFGLLPFRTITGCPLLLKDALAQAEAGTYAPFASAPIRGRTYPVFPCYFPVGRGSPKKALRILAHIRDRFGRRAPRPRTGHR